MTPTALDLDTPPRLEIDVLRSAELVPIDSVIVAFGNDAEVAWAVSRCRRLGGKVVVVDHGDGQCARVAEGMGATVVCDPTNPGFGAGQNRGVALTGSDYVLLCNPDAAILPLAVAEGARYLRQHPGVAAVQGVVRARRTGEPERSQGVELGSSHLLGRAFGARRLLRWEPVRRLARRSPRLRDHADREPAEPATVETLAATAVLVRRSAFDAVKGFDSRFFLYGEDLDLCRRLRESGWDLVALPGTWAVHGNGASSPTRWDREMRWWEGTIAFATRWWSTPAWTVAMLASTAAWVRLAFTRPRAARAAARAMLLRPGLGRLASRP